MTWVQATKLWRFLSNVKFFWDGAVDYISGKIRGKKIVNSVSQWSALSFLWVLLSRFVGRWSTHDGIIIFARPWYICDNNKLSNTQADCKELGQCFSPDLLELEWKLVSSLTIGSSRSIFTKLGEAAWSQWIYNKISLCVWLFFCSLKSLLFKVFSSLWKSLS